MIRRLHLDDEATNLANDYKANIAGVCSLVDRSLIENDFGKKQHIGNGIEQKQCSYFY